MVVKAIIRSDPSAVAFPEAARELRVASARNAFLFLRSSVEE
jgi:hypothetical protein